MSSRGRMSSREHPSSRGRPVSQGRASSVRGRTRSAATTDLLIATELPIVNFEDSAEMQQLVGEAGSIGGQHRRAASAGSIGGQHRRAASAGSIGGQHRRAASAGSIGGQHRRAASAGSIGGASRSQWEESVRLRVDRNDHMLTEMHSMLQSVMARTAHVDVNSPPVASPTVSTAPPAMVSAAAGASTAVLPPDTATASAPWPTADTTDIGITGNGTSGYRASDDHPSSHLDSRLGGTVASLQASLAPSTRLMYERSWRKITEFLVFLGLSQQLPVAVSTLLLSVAHLHELCYSPASIQYIMSAVSYFHKAHNLSDHTRAFLVSKAIIGARNLSQSVDIRLPVTPSVLSKLVASTYHVFVSPYKSLMMRMIMVLAFQAYLRIGEIIPRSKSDVQGCLRLGDVVIIDDVLTVHFRHFKHSVKQGSQTLRV